MKYIKTGLVIIGIFIMTGVGCQTFKQITPQDSKIEDNKTVEIDKIKVEEQAPLKTQVTQNDAVTVVSSKPNEIKKIPASSTDQKTLVTDSNNSSQNFPINEVNQMYRGIFGVSEAEWGKAVPEGVSWGSVEYVYYEKFVLSAAANLSDDLVLNEFYNGWLLQEGGTKYINTGKFVAKSVQGEVYYENKFSSVNNYTNYPIFIISKETGSAGSRPSKEIVRGTLKAVR